MDHSCYRCGVSVAEGRAFCPECRAPLIRVTVAEALPSPAFPHPDPSQEFASESAVSVPTLGDRMDWSNGWPAVMLGGVIGAALMIFPFGAAGLGMLTAGALAVVFYHRRATYSRLSSWVGVQLGALAGVFGFAVFTIFLAAASIFAGTEKFRAMLLEAVRQSAAKASDPEAMKVFEFFRTPPGLALLLVMCLVFLFLLSVMCSIAGGAMAAAWIRRRERR